MLLVCLVQVVNRWAGPAGPTPMSTEQACFVGVPWRATPVDPNFDASPEGRSEGGKSRVPLCLLLRCQCLKNATGPEIASARQPERPRNAQSRQQSEILPSRKRSRRERYRSGQCRRWLGRAATTAAATSAAAVPARGWNRARPVAPRIEHEAGAAGISRATGWADDKGAAWVGIR